MKNVYEGKRVEERLKWEDGSSICSYWEILIVVAKNGLKTTRFHDCDIKMFEETIVVVLVSPKLWILLQVCIFAAEPASNHSVALIWVPDSSLILKIDNKFDRFFC